MKMHLASRPVQKCLFEIPTSSNHCNNPPPLCKTVKAKNAAFRLISTLCKGCGKNEEVLLDFLYKQFLEIDDGGEEEETKTEMETEKGTEAKAEDIVRRDLEGSYWYDPSGQTKSSTGYVGLKNLSCTCYMNSLLQQFFMIPKLRAGILECRDILEAGEVKKEVKMEVEGEGEEKKVEVEEEDVDADDIDNLLFQFQNLFANLSESEKRSADTAPFVNSYKDFDGNATNPSEQQDVDEFFSVLMDRLENQLKPLKQKDLLKENFGGQILNQIICQECKNVSERGEDSLVVPLDVKGKGSVEDALKLYVEGEMLDGDNKYNCETCARKCDSLKRCCIGVLPETLILHLKR